MSLTPSDADAILAELHGIARVDVFVQVVRSLLPTAIRAKLPATDGTARENLETDFRAIASLPEPARTTAMDVWFEAARTQLGAPVAKRLDDLRGALGTVVRPPGLDGRRVPEKIILRDDMVDFAWLLRGHDAGKPVACLEVPRVFGEAKHSSTWGTGFLVDERHLLTAYHVIEARDRGPHGEPPPTPAELAAQVAGAHVWFDYLDAAAMVRPAGFARLVASDRDIDYAVLELAQPQPARGSLRLSTAPLPAVTSDEGFSVNIIQHPRGKPKRVALRNNAVCEVTDRELLYFTDTEGGSSGAPVFDDAWHVIAIHRGFEWRDNLRYMGRQVGFANAGTRVGPILAHLATAAPALHAALTATP